MSSRKSALADLWAESESRVIFIAFIAGGQVIQLCRKSSHFLWFLFLHFGVQCEEEKKHTTIIIGGLDI